jgi:hypothetical protein
MSVPSAKSSVMSVNAYLVVERNIVWLGMPSSSTSIGDVMRVSTSSGVMPGALMMILTCVGETSGNASIGSSWKARKPAAPASTVRRITSTRCESANAMSLRISQPPASWVASHSDFNALMPSTATFAPRSIPDVT